MDRAKERHYVVRGHRQKIFVPVNGFCLLGGGRGSHLNPLKLSY